MPLRLWSAVQRVLPPAWRIRWIKPQPLSARVAPLILTIWLLVGACLGMHSPAITRSRAWPTRSGTSPPRWPYGFDSRSTVSCPCSSRAEHRPCTPVVEVRPLPGAHSQRLAQWQSPWLTSRRRWFDSIDADHAGQRRDGGWRWRGRQPRERDTNASVHGGH